MSVRSRRQSKAIRWPDDWQRRFNLLAAFEKAWTLLLAIYNDDGECPFCVRFNEEHKNFGVHDDKCHLVEEMKNIAELRLGIPQRKAAGK